MKRFNFIFLCVLSMVIFLSCSDMFKSTLEVRNESSSSNYSDTITDILISEGQEEWYKSVWSGTMSSGDNVLVEIDSGAVEDHGKRESQQAPARKATCRQGATSGSSCRQG